MDAPGYQYTLVIGQDGRDRAWLEGVLMRGGLEVAACSQDELLAMPDIVPPQLVLLDDASRYEQRSASLERIFAYPPLVGVPVIVLSYDKDMESFSGAISRGAAAYVPKPVTAEEIVSIAHKISGWLSSNDRTEKRRRLRRPLLMRVDVTAGGRAPVPGTIVDVSGSGCRVELPAQLAKGEAVRLTLHGVSGSTDLSLTAEVRWQRQLADGTTIAGVRFTGTAAVLAPQLLGSSPRP